MSVGWLGGWLDSKGNIPNQWTDFGNNKIVTDILSWGKGWVEVDIKAEVDLNLRLKWGWDEIEMRLSRSLVEIELRLSWVGVETSWH